MPEISSGATVANDAVAPPGSGDIPFLPSSAVLPPAAADPGLAHPTGTVDHAMADVPAPLPDPRTDPNRPPNAHIFFGIYFCMTGLHGFHVLAGMALMLWLMVRAMRGHFGPNYFTPVDLGGLYWHVVDLIWIFLFPLLYLI